MRRCYNCGEPYTLKASNQVTCDFCLRMRNQAMARKLRKGETIDVAGFQRTSDGDYILPDYADDIDYCDSRTEEWIWSIGQENASRRILASTTTKFYQNPNYKCLWLR